MYRIVGADGREYGPVTAEQLRQWIAEGRANAETRAAAEPVMEWKPLGTFPEFSLLFAARRPAAPVLAGAPARKTNSLAVAGLIMGILSVILVCCCYGFPFNVLGLTFSIIGLAQIRANPQSNDGQGAAIAGLVLSLLSLLLAVAILLIYGAAAWHDGTHRIYRL